MEATGDYWKPFYYLLEHAPFELMLVNPTHARNIPGRKSDVSDAQWLAELAAHGLVRGSVVPPPPIRVLRDLTRTRVTLTQDRVREINRLDKVLEDAGIKLSSVTSDILGVSGRAMLEALVAGERDPRVLAALARMGLRNKTEQLAAALVGGFTDHHAFMVRLHLQLIDRLAAGIAALTARIDILIEPFRPVLKLLTTIPGVSDKVAVVIFAETGADMTRFPPRRISRPGQCLPEPERIRRQDQIHQPTPGNSYIKAALGNAAMGAARTNGCYFQARYRRLAARSSALKARVAVEHSILVSVWNMITNNQNYHDLGGDYYTRRDPAAALRRIVRQANALGMAVRFDPIEQPT